MWFVVKCVFWLGLVFLAVAGRGGEPGRQAAKPAEKAAAATKSKSAGATRGGDALSALVDKGAQSVAGAARDHCLAHPIDCLLAGEKLGLVRPEPAKR